MFREKTTTKRRPDGDQGEKKKMMSYSCIGAYGLVLGLLGGSLAGDAAAGAGAGGRLGRLRRSCGCGRRRLLFGLLLVVRRESSPSPHRSPRSHDRKVVDQVLPLVLGELVHVRHLDAFGRARRNAEPAVAAFRDVDIEPGTYRRFFVPTDVRPRSTSGVDLIVSIVMQSTGHAIAHWSQPMQSSMFTYRRFRARSGSFSFTSGYWIVTAGVNR